MTNSSGRWLELSLDAATEAVDAIVEVFHRNGVGGVAIETAVEPGTDEGFAVSSAQCEVKAYLSLGPGVEEQVEKLERSLWHLRAFDLSPLSELRAREIAEEDWANAWKEHFHPLRIGRRLVVKPTWTNLETKPGEIVLELDPGMAFGTGLHPTTRMVLEALENWVRSEATVLDVGTGSGILALAAARLGAARVLAVDTEEVAVRVALENVRLNGLDDVVSVCHGSVDQASGPFDLILANIIASVIAGISADLAHQLAPGGALIASGIIAQRLPEVTAAFQRSGLEVCERLQTDDWLCLVARLA